MAPNSSFFTGYNDFLLIFSDSQKIYNEGAIRYNLGVIDYCRTSMSALSGGAAGILGLTAFQVTCHDGGFSEEVVMVPGGIF